MSTKVSIIAVTGTSGISAAQIGLALSYIGGCCSRAIKMSCNQVAATVTQTASAMTRQQAELENYMNSVERGIAYSLISILAHKSHGPSVSL